MGAVHTKPAEEAADAQFLYSHALAWSHDENYANWYANRYTGSPLEDCPAHTGAWARFQQVRCGECGEVTPSTERGERLCTGCSAAAGIGHGLRRFPL